MTYLVLFAFNFASVALKSIQQIQVSRFEYLKVIPVSYGQSYTFIFNLALVAPLYAEVDKLLIAGFWWGTGAWMGSWLGMRIKERGRNG